MRQIGITSPTLCIQNPTYKTTVYFNFKYESVVKCNKRHTTQSSNNSIILAYVTKIGKRLFRAIGCIFFIPKGILYIKRGSISHNTLSYMRLCEPHYEQALNSGQCQKIGNLSLWDCDCVTNTERTRENATQFMPLPTTSNIQIPFQQWTTCEDSTVLSINPKPRTLELQLDYWRRPRPQQGERKHQFSRDHDKP